MVRLDARVVALKVARVSLPASSNGHASYALTNRARADFVYYRLTPRDFLFLPAGAIPRAGTTFVDTPASKYR